MSAHWEINGRALAHMRAAAGLTSHDLAVRMGLEDRDVVGVEKGFRRFKNEADARVFAHRAQEACKSHEEFMRSQQRPPGAARPPIGRAG